jgi:hypothetical protein
MARARDSFSDLFTRILTGSAIAWWGWRLSGRAPWFTLLSRDHRRLVWELATMLGAAPNTGAASARQAGLLAPGGEASALGPRPAASVPDGFRRARMLLPRNRSLFLASPRLSCWQASV